MIRKKLLLESIERLERRLDKLECEHYDVSYSIDTYTPNKYHIYCKHCKKYMGTATYKEKLIKDKEFHSNQLKTINKQLKDCE